ncbi:MAG: FAD/NAD(P)-binding protein [Gammaproteobacteria bacterium]|nr:FAD/NAD(P)-binding protein [Gammaproteobacteria bacterium]
MRRNYTIAIVGGGASGVGLAARMVEALPIGLSTANLSIALFDARGCQGGNAYADDTPSNLMNTTCGAIDRGFGGAFSFLGWASENPHRWRPLLGERTLDTQAYVPRPVVGRYLADLLANARQKAAGRRLELDAIAEEVVDIEPPDTPERNYSVHTESGTCFEARYIYLALGHLDRVKSEDYQYQDRYYHNPYPISRLIEEIPRDAAVGIIGTRLSAIDVTLGLAGAGHAGEVVCVSRGGRLPAVRADQGKHEFRNLEREDLFKELKGRRTKLRLADVATMIGSEIEYAEGRRVELGDIVRDDVSPVEYYEREIALARGRTRPWQAVLYATNRNIDLLWHHLAEEDKRLLMSEWLNDWLTYRASIPRENAERILGLMKSGRLQVRRGASGFEYDDATGNFNMLLDADEAVPVQYLVAATGSASRIEDADSDLMGNLLARGLVRPHRYGGVDCRFENGQVIPRDDADTADTRMFALGPLTSGVYFFTTALEIIQRQAAQRTLDLAFMLGVEWLDLPETEAWVDARQAGQLERTEEAPVPHDEGPDLLERLVADNRLDLIDFEQLHLLNDQIPDGEFQVPDRDTKTA